MLRANKIHNCRPTAMPSGTPTTIPMTAVALACQMRVTANWRLVNPRVFKSARSRRRVRTVAVSARARATTAPVARPEAEHHRRAPRGLVVHDLRRPLDGQDVHAVASGIGVSGEGFVGNGDDPFHVVQARRGLTWARNRTKTSAGPSRVGSGDLVARRKLAGRSASVTSAPVPMVVWSAKVLEPAMAGNVAVPTTTAGVGGRYKGRRVGRAVADEDLVADVLVQERQRRRAQDHLAAPVQTVAGEYRGGHRGQCPV